MPKLERSQWYDLYRDMNWDFKYVISGLELQSQLTATVSNHRIPVVFITAHDDEATRQRALNGGAVDFLRKPVRREVLLHAVHSALQQNDASFR